MFYTPGTSNETSGEEMARYIALANLLSPRQVSVDIYVRIAKAIREVHLKRGNFSCGMRDLLTKGKVIYRRPNSKRGKLGDTISLSETCGHLSVGATLDTLITLFRVLRKGAVQGRSSHDLLSKSR